MSDDRSEKEQHREQVLQLPIAEMGLAARVTEILEQHGIQTLKDLLAYGEEDLLRMPEFSRTTVKRLSATLSECGLRLRSN